MHGQRPAPIRELAARLEDLTAAVAKSARLEDLHENVRSAWKLTAESYLDFKAATDTPERRDNLRVQIAAAFAPLARDGVLGPDALPPNEDSSRLLSIRKVGEPPSAARLVPASGSSPSASSSPTGRSIKSSVRLSPRPRSVRSSSGSDRQPVRRRRRRCRSRPRPRPSSAKRRGTASPTIMTPTPGAKCWSKRPSLSARSSSSSFVSSTMRRWPRSALATAPGGSWGSSRLVAALYFLAGYYVYRQERRFVGDPGRVAMICGLVILALAVVRILAARPGMPRWSPWPSPA